MKKRRAAAIGIAHELIHDMLKLPEGIRISAIEDDFDRMMLKIRLNPTSDDVYWDALVEVGEGQLIPMAYLGEGEDDYLKLDICLNFRWWAIIAAKARWVKIKRWFKEATS